MEKKQKTSIKRSDFYKIAVNVDFIILYERRLKVKSYDEYRSSWFIRFMWFFSIFLKIVTPIPLDHSNENSVIERGNRFNARVSPTG